MSNTFNSDADSMCGSVFLLDDRGGGSSSAAMPPHFVLIVCMRASLSPQQCGWNRNYTWVGGKAEKEVGESREAGRGRRRGMGERESDREGQPSDGCIR